MGYMQEETTAARHLIHRAVGQEAGFFQWPRNGGFPILLHLPFMTVSHFLFGDSTDWEDRILSLEPVLLMSLICLILFSWIQRLTDPLWALLLTSTAAFCTMLWPYAYIGLESGQAASLLTAAYIAIARPGERRWAGTVFFGVICGLAVSLKSTGLFLAPAVLFLIAVYFECDRSPWRPPRQHALKLMFCLMVVGVMTGLAAYTRSFFWVQFGGTRNYILSWLIPDPLDFVFNAIASLSSPNKGLFVFAPVTLLSFFALFRLARAGSRIAILTLLTGAGIVGGFSMLRAWTDENWGPRYLLTCVPLLMLCLAELRRGIAFRPIRELGLIIAAIVGFAVSLPGALFAYGSMHQIATEVGQNTLQALHGDPSWNHVRFNGKLLHTFLATGDAAASWPPVHRAWNFGAPQRDSLVTRTTIIKTFHDNNDRAISVPQTFIVRMRASSEGGAQILSRILLLCLATGVGMLGLVTLRIIYAVAANRDASMIAAGSRPSE